MKNLQVLLTLAFMMGSAPLAQSATCTTADAATYDRLEREYDAALEKCGNAMKLSAAKQCTACRPLHAAMWRAERWRDQHSACLVQTKANLERVRKYHQLTARLDKDFAAQCAY